VRVGASLEVASGRPRAAARLLRMATSTYQLYGDRHEEGSSILALLVVSGRGLGLVRPQVVHLAGSWPRNVATLPPGYRPAVGAVPLLGSAILSVDTAFYRYTGSANDPRLAGGSLARDTYLTTELDKSYANTGFAAVGRYALPLPVPSSHVHVYVLPQGTTLRSPLGSASRNEEVERRLENRELL
jgi:hypothetical protein